VTRTWLSGAGGFLGHHVLEHLLEETDWDVTATDSFRHHGKTDRIAHVLDTHDQRLLQEGKRPWWRERVTVVTHDLAVPFSTQAVAATGHVDYMIALASESHVDRSLADPVPFAMNNAAVALTTLELARSLQPRALVLLSTDEVYGPVRGGESHREWSPAVPSNPYAASKAAQEAYAIAWWRSYGVPVIIVNVMNILGERQAAEKYLPTLIRTIYHGDVVRVHAGPGGVGSRHYLHARNVADAILFALRDTKAASWPEADRPTRFSLPGQVRLTNLELAEMTANVLGRPLRYELADSGRPGYDPHYGLASARLASLGWRPPVELRPGIERAVRWTAEHPEWMGE
jgi:dTDP-glucose 4,6-dehydratase